MPTRRWRRGRARLAAVIAGATVLFAGSFGCAGLRSGDGNDYQAVVTASPEATLRIARTQLERRGFKVVDAGAGVVVTQPAAVPAQLQDKAGHLKARHWVVRVSADPQTLTSGTRLRVVGYLLPPAATSAGGRTASRQPQQDQQQQAIPVTASQRELFSEVRAIGRAVEADANGKGG